MTIKDTSQNEVVEELFSKDLLMVPSSYLVFQAKLYVCGTSSMPMLPVCRWDPFYRCPWILSEQVEKLSWYGVSMTLWDVRFMTHLQMATSGTESKAWMTFHWLTCRWRHLWMATSGTESKAWRTFHSNGYCEVADLHYAIVTLHSHTFRFRWYIDHRKDYYLFKNANQGNLLQLIVRTVCTDNWLEQIKMISARILRP